MSETSNAYRTVVVGTDGSQSSLRAVRGRVTGPVPAHVTRPSECDVLAVNPTG